MACLQGVLFAHNNAITAVTSGTKHNCALTTKMRVSSTLFFIDFFPDEITCQFNLQLYCFGEGHVNGRVGLRSSQNVAAVDAKPMPFNCSVLLAEAGAFHVIVLSSSLEVPLRFELCQMTRSTRQIT